MSLGEHLFYHRQGADGFRALPYEVATKAEQESAVGYPGGLTRRGSEKSPSVSALRRYPGRIPALPSLLPGQERPISVQNMRYYTNRSFRNGNSGHVPILPMTVRTVFRRGWI
jgi:hypothetical protein